MDQGARESTPAKDGPFCDECGVEITTGMMAALCPRAEACEFWPDDEEGAAFIRAARPAGTTLHYIGESMSTKLKLIAPHPTASFVEMTADLVENLLAMNTNNRHVRESVAAAYQRAMEHGLWIPTNQGIGVSASGFLIDGQHRLLALRAAGYPRVLMLLVLGLPDQSVGAVDAGTNRTARDYLQFLFDTKVSAFVSAVLRMHILAQENFNPRKLQPHEYAVAFKKLGSSIDKFLSITHASKLPAAAAAALVDSINNGYEPEVEAFTLALITGEMLERENPALMLRNWLSSVKGSGSSDIATERYRKTLRALQAWIDGRPIKRLHGTRAPLTGQDRARAN